jgi:hypothetical protein
MINLRDNDIQEIADRFMQKPYIEVCVKAKRKFLIIPNFINFIFGKRIGRSNTLSIFMVHMDWEFNINIGYSETSYVGLVRRERL